jgi:hypothetical protein
MHYAERIAIWVGQDNVVGAVRIAPVYPSGAESNQSFNLGGLADLSNLHFSRTQVDYLLGEDALAHVTLCEFLAENNDLAIEAYKSYADKESLLLPCLRGDRQGVHRNPGQGALMNARRRARASSLSTRGM